MFLLLRYRGGLYILDAGYLSDIYFAKILFKSVTCLFIPFNNVLQKANVFHFNKMQYIKFSLWIVLLVLCNIIINFGQFSAIIKSTISSVPFFFLLIFLLLTCHSFCNCFSILGYSVLFILSFFSSLLFRLQNFLLIYL